jgi:hypothetical protein
MIPILIFGTGGFGGEGLDASLTGGVTHFLGTDLHPLWYLPNGVWRTHQGETEENPLVPPPFSEFEITYCLNPGQRDAKVAMTLQYRNLDHVTLDFTAPAERLLTWNNYEQVPVNQPYGVKIAASEPIAVSAVRYVYDPRGLAEKGIFCSARSCSPAASPALTPPS